MGFSPKPRGFAGTPCAAAIGMRVFPVLFQGIRVLSFIPPGIAWGCSRSHRRGSGVAASAFVGAGIGIQQLFHHSFDVSIGTQRIFRRGSGMQMGISATYVWLR